MLESEARTKICPHIVNPHITRVSNCYASGCMMWRWETPEDTFIGAAYDETDKPLKELLETQPHKSKPKDGWIERKDGCLGWQRRIPDKERHGSCGLANLTVYVEGP